MCEREREREKERERDVCVCVRVLSAFGMRQTLIVGMAGEEEGAKRAEVGGKQQEDDTRNIQRLQLAEQTKEKGNVAFKGGDLEAAAANYHKVAHPQAPHTHAHTLACPLRGRAVRGGSEQLLSASSSCSSWLATREDGRSGALSLALCWRSSSLSRRRSSLS